MIVETIACGILYLIALVPVLLVSNGTMVNTFDPVDKLAFISTYAGAVTGGYFTLVSMVFSVGRSLKMRNMDRDDRREEQKIEAQRALLDDIAENLGKYITYVSDYNDYVTTLCALRTEEKRATDNLEKAKSEQLQVNANMNTTENEIDTEKSRNLVGQYNKITSEVDKLTIIQKEKARSVAEYEKQKNTIEIEKAYFVIMTKLSHIDEATEFRKCLETKHKEAKDDSCSIEDMEGMINTLTGAYNSFMEVYLQEGNS